MSKDFSTFMDGSDCKDCKAYEKEIKELKVLIEQYRGALGYPVRHDIIENNEIKNGIANAIAIQRDFLKKENEKLKKCVEFYAHCEQRCPECNGTGDATNFDGERIDCKACNAYGFISMYEGGKLARRTLKELNEK